MGCTHICICGNSFNRFLFVIGILTAILGILSEALHSGLDLDAAVGTYFSVRILFVSYKPGKRAAEVLPDKAPWETIN